MAAFTCDKCGCTDVIIRQVNSKTGVYCRNCGAWLAWIKVKDISKIRADAKYTDDQAERKITKYKGTMLIKCGNCRTLLYNSSKQIPEGSQFNLIDAKYCPYCGRELV